MKSEKIVEDKDEDKELIKPTEDIDDDLLNTHLGMTTFLKNNHKHESNDTKNNDLYVDSRFIFGSVAHEERPFSHRTYIKIETRTRLITQFLSY